MENSVNRVVVVIPARYASKRLPGKPLRNIAGKSLIHHVFRCAEKIKLASEIIVATDDHRILQEVASFSGRAVMTDPGHPSGSDRIASVVKNMDCQIVVNLQGDEPIVDTRAIDQAIQIMQEQPEIEFATLGFPLQNSEDAHDPNIVKVLVDKNHNALYFSRAPIPHFREGRFQQNEAILQHIGVYLYRKEALLNYISWPPSALEKAEKLEQLRILSEGVKIYVHTATQKSIGVDVEEDISVIEKMLKKEGGN